MAWILDRNRVLAVKSRYGTICVALIFYFTNIKVRGFYLLLRDNVKMVSLMGILHEPLPRRLPIGIQSNMGKPYFLSRPRRFGKSLFLLTLEAFFWGKCELFKGLAMVRLESEWAEHVVLHLDLNAERYDSVNSLRDMLERQLLRWEEKYATGGKGITYSDRFEEVISRAYEQIYIVFGLMGQFSEAEVRSARGRADAVVKTHDAIYVFEFKLNGMAKKALQQIDTQGYLIPYTVDGRQIIRVGVEFDASERNLGRWLIV